MGACLSCKQVPPSSSLHDLPADLVCHILGLLWPDKRPSRFSKVEAREWCQYATVCQTWRRHFRGKRVSFMFTHGSVPLAVQQWLARPGAPPADIACVTVPYRWIDHEDSP